MKHKQILSVLLSAALVVTPAYSVFPEEVQETAAEQSMEEPEESPETSEEADAEDTEEEASGEEPEAEESPEEEKDDEEKTTGGGGYEKEESERYVDPVQAALKEDFLKIISCTAKRTEDEILVTLVTGNPEYNRLFFGGIGEEKDPIIPGERDPEGAGFVFTFAVTEDLLGLAVPVIPCSTEGAWFEEHPLYVLMPASASAPDTDPEEEPGEAPEEDTEDTAIPEQAEETGEAPVPELADALFLEDTAEVTVDNTAEEPAENSAEEPAEDTTEEPAENSAEDTDGEDTVDPEDPRFLEGPEISGEHQAEDTLSEDPETEDAFFVSASAVNNSTTLEDGEYTPESFEFAGGTGKAATDCKKVIVKDGKATAIFTTTSSNMTHYYMGYAESSDETLSLYDPSTGVLGDDVYEITDKQAEVPVVLNKTMDFAGRTTAMGAPHWIRYTYKITLAEPTPTTEPEQPALADGTYAIAESEYGYPMPENGILYEGTMFNVTKFGLISKAGKMEAKVTLHGTGLDALYIGTKEEAAKAKEEDLIPPIVENGEYSYILPIEKLDVPFAVAKRSKRDHEAGNTDTMWYDMQLIIRSDKLTKTGEENTLYSEQTSGGTDNTDPGTGGTGNTNPGGADNADPGSGSNGNSGSGSSGGSSSGTGGGSSTKGGGSTTGSGSQYTANTNGSTASVDSSTGLQDGTYEPDSFSWAGGTGKLSIDCTSIRVSGGQAYATILFTSGKITYVKADGQQFGPQSQSSSQTVFEIPVPLNQNFSILACTTAMSQPHEVEYTLYVGLEAAKSATKTGSGSGVSASKSGTSGSESTVDGTEAGTKETLVSLEDAPKVAGLSYVGSLKTEYADYFKIHYYKEEYRVVEISLSRETSDKEKIWKLKTVEEKEAELSDKEETAEIADSEEGGSVVEQKSLYEDNVLTYLIAPEGAELPAGIGKQMIVVQEPVEKAYVDSENVLKIADKIGSLDKVTTIGFEKEEIGLDSVKKAVEEQKITSVGHYDKPQYRQMVIAKTDLAVVPASVVKKAAESPEEFSIRDLGDDFSLLNIPMIVDRTDDEKEALAKYEWAKVYGVLFREEEKAEEVYKAAVQASGDTSGEKESKK